MRITINCYEIKIKFLIDKKLVRLDNIQEKDLKQTITDRVQQGIEIPLQQISVMVKN